MAAPAIADPVTSGWSFGLSCPPKGNGGTGTMSAANGGGFGGAGTCLRAGLFTKVSFSTSAGGTLRGADAIALQTPSVLVIPPLLNTESQPIFSVATACPITPGTLDLNWLFVQWTETERRALANTYFFGTAQYSRANGTVITGQYDIDGSVYWAGPRPMYGSCSNGVYAISGDPYEDINGNIYFNAGGMGAFKTSSGRATFFFPRFALTPATHFGSKSFRGIMFDSNSGNGVGDVRQITATADAGGTTFTLQPLSDPENGVVDGAYTDTVSFAGPNINSPAPGMLYGTLTRTGTGAGSGRVGCIANGDDGDVMLLCSGESPADNTLPFHFSIYAENRGTKASGLDAGVFATVPGAAGKLYVGGNFTNFGDASRNYIARLNADGSLDTSFNPGTGFNGQIYALAYDSTADKIVAAGVFTSFNGTGRARIARLNADGSLDTTFDPGLGFGANVPSTIAIDANTRKIYAGGNFTAYNGTGRNYIVRIDVDGSVDTGFNPGTGFNFNVAGLTFDSTANKLYCVGGFASYDGTTRNSVARIDTSGALDTSFDPGGSGFGPSGPGVVFVDSVSGKVYIGGNFTMFNGSPSVRIARLTTTGALDTTFSSGAGPDNGVQGATTDSSGRVYVVGGFTTFDGSNRRGIARLNTNGTVDTSFDPAGGFVGGETRTVNVDAGTGKVSVSGFFTGVNGAGRDYVARLDSAGAVDTGYGDGGVVGGQVQALAYDLTSKEIYVGGVFTAVGGYLRSTLARFTADGSVDSTFDAGTGIDFFGAFLNTFAVDSSAHKLFVGGGFNAVNGTSRNFIARLNSNGTVDTSFDPGSGFAGSFGSGVYSLYYDAANSKLYAGGTFTAYNGTARVNIARINSTNGALDTSFNPGAGCNGSVRSLAYVPSTGQIYAGGYFSQCVSTTRNGVARFNGNGTLDTSFDPGTGPAGVVMAIALDADTGKLYVAGSFTSFGGVSRNGIVRLNSNGAVDTSFNPGTGFSSSPNIAGMAFDGVNVTVVGTFTTFNGVSRNNIVRITSSGALDTTFNPGSGFNNNALALAVHPVTGKISVGGGFTRYGARTAPNFIRLNYSGAVD